jgi:putative aldouronate transport system permease protein
MTERNNFKTQIALNTAVIILCAFTAFPFLLVLGVSFSNEADIVRHGYNIFPKNFDLSAYMYVLKNPLMILNAYKVTFIFSAAATFLGTLLMATAAYPLTQKDFKGRNKVAFYLYFTMLFSGGLVPSYILMTKYLHLDDNILVYILPGLISPWYIFMMRSFLQGIHKEIFEAAHIDGANQYTVFFKMVLPLSKPVLATVALFTFLGKWNDWYTAMLYINKDSLVSLQYLLQRIMLNIRLLQNGDTAFAEMANEGDIPAETVRMAMAVIVAGPALLVFPFFQKYFVKGLTVGSVKG